MDDAADCERRLHEICALASIYDSTSITDLPAGYDLALQLLIAGESKVDAAALAADLCGQPCSGVLHLQAEHSGRCVGAELHFTLPPSYPSSRPASCHVRGDASIPRALADAWTAALQEVASQQVGEEVLFSLAEALTSHLEQHAQQQQQQEQQQQVVVVEDTPGTHQGGTGAGPPAPGAAALRRVLLRLDHMRQRAPYARTIQGWAAQLGLTGLLLFCGPLILIALEGPPPSITSYLRLARTTTVDVDAAGRKCRERMMDVLEDTLAPPTASVPDTGHTQSPHHSGHGNMQRCPQQQQEAAGAAPSRVFQGFRELDCQDLGEVVALVGGAFPAWGVQDLQRLVRS